VPPIFVTKIVCPELKKLENHCCRFITACRILPAHVLHIAVAVGAVVVMAAGVVAVVIQEEALVADVDVVSSVACVVTDQNFVRS
jgi:hypothetical protein